MFTRAIITAILLPIYVSSAAAQTAPQPNGSSKKGGGNISGGMTSGGSPQK